MDRTKWKNDESLYILTEISVILLIIENFVKDTGRIL